MEQNGLPLFFLNGDLWAFILGVHQENGMLLESTSRDWQHWQHSILVGASCP